jgi:hypothetical protein
LYTFLNTYLRKNYSEIEKTTNKIHEPKRRLRYRILRHLPIEHIHVHPDKLFDFYKNIYHLIDCNIYDEYDELLQTIDSFLRTNLMTYESSPKSYNSCNSCNSCISGKSG